MQWAPINNVGYDAVFSGCEDNNDFKDVVNIYIYIYIYIYI